MSSENKSKWHRPELAKSEVIKQIPLACQNELAAVEFLEKQRWGEMPCCVHCGSTNVYKMVDAKTGERSKRFLWLFTRRMSRDCCAVVSAMSRGVRRMASPAFCLTTARKDDPP